VRFFKALIRKCFYTFFKACPLASSDLTTLWDKASIIAIMAVSGIGDAVMATPLIEAVHQKKPDCRLIVIASETTQSIFKNNPCISTRYVMSENNYSIIQYLKLIIALRREKVQFFFAAQPSNVIKCSITAALSGAKIRF
jgi:ADP-heptose:LPS heptosyltransferase